MNKQRRNRKNKQTDKTNKNSRFGTIEFQSYFNLWCYSSSIQSWCWYLSRSFVIVSPGGWVVYFFLFFLSFRGSCLVSSSLSWVWQFKFVCCPQILEISSIAHQLSCFGVGFSLCLVTGGLFLHFSPFLWGKVSYLSASPLLSASCDGWLIIFQFFNVIWLWMSLTGSGDELCWPLPALFQAVSYHPPTVGPSPFLAICLLKVRTEISS
jgi:hypothetical protein